ncbi:MAG: rhodanese-like domain-containing protein [Burkholderiaceae bacterium]|nr:rhodanese-like domain-containing protein [Burkholderiaceae bacterium]
MKFFIDNISNVWLLAIVLVSGGMLLWPILQRRGAKVSILQATQLFNQGKTLLLDVREEAEFAAGHVRDAKNIPLKQLPTRLGEIDKFKDKTVIAVCATGVRSASASGLLKKSGFADVYSLDGGMTAWQSQGLPTVK